LLSPCVPLLFMGEEYGEERPFPFFCSFDDPIIVEAMRRGRRQEFADLAFRWGSDIPDPQDPKTFAAAKLGWEWPEGSAHAQLRRLYQDLLAARRQLAALRDRRHTIARLLNDSSSDNPAILVLQRGGEGGLSAVANLTMKTMSIADLKLGSRKVLLSTEDACYGGSRSLLPSPFERGAEGEGENGEGCNVFSGSLSSLANCPHPIPLPKGEGTFQQILPHELLVFDGRGGQL
jgi:maltooligosyltrehalose trehalohydrolase